MPSPLKTGFSMFRCNKLERLLHPVIWVTAICYTASSDLAAMTTLSAFAHFALLGNSWLYYYY